MLDQVESRPAPIQQKIATLLRAQLLSGRYRPGDRLPSARELADDINHSPSTVLEAYRILAAEGFIELREKSRPRVRDSDSVSGARHTMLRARFLAFIEQFRSQGFTDDELRAAARRTLDF